MVKWLAYMTSVRYVTCSSLFSGRDFKTPALHLVQDEYLPIVDED